MGVALGVDGIRTYVCVCVWLSVYLLYVVCVCVCVGRCVCVLYAFMYTLHGFDCVCSSAKEDAEDKSLQKVLCEGNQRTHLVQKVSLGPARRV